MRIVLVLLMVYALSGCVTMEFVCDIATGMSDECDWT
jgi:uncharacterized protein YceK